MTDRCTEIAPFTVRDTDDGPLHHPQCNLAAGHNGFHRSPSGASWGFRPAGLVEYTERAPDYAGLTVHEIRAEALDAAVRIADSAEMPEGWTVRDQEALVIGAAERLADWISDGTYDFSFLRDGSTQP